MEIYRIKRLYQEGSLKDLGFRFKILEKEKQIKPKVKKKKREILKIVEEIK